MNFNREKNLCEEYYSEANNIDISVSYSISNSYIKT